MPKYKTESDDPFIGSKFGKNDCMEVIGWWEDEPYTSYKIRNYKVLCKECAKDPELFGKGHFKSIRRSMIDGQIPCGCSVAPKWKYEQYKVILKRLCESKNYTITNLPDSFIDARTKINLTCNVCSNKWSTTVNCLQNGQSCPKCAINISGVKRRRNDDEMIADFMNTGNFAEGTKFVRVFDEAFKWEVHCPKCSNDEYVKVGLCSGIFISRAANLRKGRKPCRCSMGYDWPKELREYKIKSLASEGNLKYNFIGWTEKRVSWGF